MDEAILFIIIIYRFLGRDSFDYILYQGIMLKNKILVHVCVFAHNYWSLMARIFEGYLLSSLAKRNAIPSWSTISLSVW